MPARARRGARANSALEKAADSARSTERFFTEAAPAAGDAARALAERATAAAGGCYSMGNGGSSCDAAHIAVEFQHPVTAGRPALPAHEPGRRHGHDDRRSATTSASTHVFVAPADGAVRARGDALLGVSTSGNSANLLRRLRHRARAGRWSPWRWAAATAARCARRPASITAWWCRQRQHPPRPGDACRRSTTSCGTWCTPCSPTIAARRRRGRRHEIRRRVPRSATRRARWCARSQRAGRAHRRRRRRRPLQLMEVCGGHTHAIFRYGIEGPAAGRRSSSCTARAARCACCRWDASTTAWRIAQQPGVIFTTFGDAMRVPGSHESLLQAKADGADVRMVYSPLDALDAGAAPPGPRGGVLRARLRDHHAVAPR